MEASIEAIKANCEQVGLCWEWKGAMHNGLPVMRRAGVRKTESVRRVVMELSGLEIPPGKFACAKCLNGRCVAPHHAEALTRKKLQQRTAETTLYQQSLTRNIKLSQAARQRSNLTEEKVAEMRQSGLSTRAAAKMYGCSQSVASDIMSRRTWRDYSNPFASLLGRAV